MKASEQFLVHRKLREEVFNIQVPSKTVKGDSHTVRIVGGRIADCDCIGYGIRHKCSHQGMVLDYLENKRWKTRKKQQKQ